MSTRVSAARLLDGARDRIALATVEDEYQRRAEFWARFGPRGRVRCVEDTAFHLRFLACSLMMGEPTIFWDYIAWLVPLLGRHGIGVENVRENLISLRQAIRSELPALEASEADRLLDGALERL